MNSNASGPTQKMLWKFRRLRIINTTLAPEFSQVLHLGNQSLLLQFSSTEILRLKFSKFKSALRFVALQRKLQNASLETTSDGDYLIWQYGKQSESRSKSILRSSTCSSSRNRSSSSDGPRSGNRDPGGSRVVSRPLRSISRS